MEKSGVILMLMGEYHHNLDEKNRLIIPSKLREEMGDLFVLTRGLDGCLFIQKKNGIKSLKSIKNYLIPEMLEIL